MASQRDRNVELLTELERKFRFNGPGWINFVLDQSYADAIQYLLETVKQQDNVVDTAWKLLLARESAKEAGSSFSNGEIDTEQYMGRLRACAIAEREFDDALCIARGRKET